MAEKLRLFLLFWLSLFSPFCFSLAATKLDECHVNNFSAINKLCKKCGLLNEESTIEKDVCRNLDAAFSVPRPMAIGSKTKEFLQCNRCCVLSDCTFGMDLRNCSIPKPLLGEIEEDTSLHFIIVEKTEPCPGDNSNWKEISYFKDVKICKNSSNACINVTCPSNSHCVANGTEAECLCDAGWHGYKCLRYGTFPAKEWLCSIAAGALVITFVLWSFQRVSIRVMNLKKEMMDQLASLTAAQNARIESTHPMPHK